MIDISQPVHGLLPGKLQGVLARLGGQFNAQLVVLHQATEGIGPGCGLVTVDKQTAAPIVDSDGEPANIRRDNGSAGGLSLHCHQPEGFIVTGHGDNICGLVKLRQVLRRTWGMKRTR